jgi:hypothetical protein
MDAEDDYDSDADSDYDPTKDAEAAGSDDEEIAEKGLVLLTTKRKREIESVFDTMREGGRGVEKEDGRGV